MDPISVSVNFRSKKSAGEQIYSQIRTHIQLKRLLAGEQLPPVRELAARLNVNFNTVARAYRQLDRDGLISTQQGRGTFVLEQNAEKTDPILISKQAAFLQQLKVFLQSQEEQTGLPESQLWKWIKQERRTLQGPQAETRARGKKKIPRKHARPALNNSGQQLIQRRPKKTNRLARFAENIEIHAAWKNVSRETLHKAR